MRHYKERIYILRTVGRMFRGHNQTCLRASQPVDPGGLSHPMARMTSSAARCHASNACLCCRLDGHAATYSFVSLEVTDEDVDSGEAMAEILDAVDWLIYLDFGHGPQV